jgi:hypothetical protein
VSHPFYSSARARTLTRETRACRLRPSMVLGEFLVCIIPK